jgi:hypothetical protein
MDCILLSEFSGVRDGLELMLTAAIGDHGYHMGYVDVAVALLVIEAAKRADDRPEWFPHGRWATIQAMQQRTEDELAKMFREAPETVV